MLINELHKKYNQFCQQVSKRRLIDAFDLLRQMSSEFQVGHYSFTIDNYFETYKNILKYSFELTEDPEKDKIYLHLIRSILELADEIKESILVKNKLLSIYRIKEDITRQKEIDEGQEKELIEKITFEKEILSIMEESGQTNKAWTELNENRLIHLFNIIWFSDKLKETEIQLLKGIYESSLIPWYDKALLVNALLLSVHRYFDASKIRILLEIYSQQENQVWQRALVALFSVVIHYSERLEFYPDILYKLVEIGTGKKSKKDLENLIIQFVRSRETEKITRKINEEIMPEMMKIKSMIEDKLDLKNIITIAQSEDKNPDWENFFKDTPGVYEKMEEFTKMQMEGSDVFMSAFSSLKFFPFFQQFTNWFKPFYKENPMVGNALKELGSGFNAAEFAEGLERSVFICNSDKYSFCLNLRLLPSAQKDMIKNLFAMELKAMNELSGDDELLNASARDKSIFTQYLQDLYRFHKLHPLKNEFYNFFLVPFDLGNSLLFKKMLGENKVIRNIGEFYFEKGFYADALGIFEKLTIEQSDFELLEKIAYCYQHTGKYKQALDYYLKAELFDKNREWIINKIAYCYRMLGNYKEALNYYKDAEKLDPENLSIQVNLGNTCMEMQDYETALKYYYKIEYLSPDNHKVQRPIAWCSFITGKFDAARKYFTKIISSEKSKHDFLNLGHVEWCSNNKKSAIIYYSSAFRESGNDSAWFTEAFSNDSPHLIRHGINASDIPLMIDFVKLLG